MPPKAEFKTRKNEALATFTTYASYPALDCLSQNFVQCGQAMKKSGPSGSKFSRPKVRLFASRFASRAKFAPEANLDLLPDFKMHFKISIFSYNFVFEGLIFERKTYNM